MKIPGLAVVLALVSCSAAASPQADDGWTSLFDGKTLTGWVARGGGVFSVDQGTILGLTGSGAYGWLCSEKSYGDFILEVDTKIEAMCDGTTDMRDIATALESEDQTALVTLSSAGIVARSVHFNMSTWAVGRTGRSAGSEIFGSSSPTLGPATRPQPERAMASMKRHKRPFPLLT